MLVSRKYFKFALLVVLITSLLTWFYFAHETFPVPLRALTALLATPVAISSGISHYLNLGIEVYESFVAVVLTNLATSCLIVYLAYKWKNRKRRIEEKD